MFHRVASCESLAILRFYTCWSFAWIWLTSVVIVTRRQKNFKWLKLHWPSRYWAVAWKMLWKLVYELWQQSWTGFFCSSRCAHSLLWSFPFLVSPGKTCSVIWLATETLFFSPLPAGPFHIFVVSPENDGAIWLLHIWSKLCSSSYRLQVGAHLSFERTRRD